MQLLTQLIIPVVSTSCVMAVVAYGVVRTKLFHMILLDKKLTFRNQLALIVPFTIFSAYGAVNAIPVAGVYVALAHVGQIVGGLLAGPIVGIGAGTILAVFRFLFGDYIALPASLACMMAGLFAGMYHEWYKEFNYGKLDAKRAVIFTVLVELFGSGLSLVLLPDFEKTLHIEIAGALPMILGNALAVGLFIFIMNALLAEKETLAVKERIESELQVARDIQLSLVPKTFPAPPAVKEFEVFAVLEPAKEVGGDLYDFFLVDDDHFCFVIGDVSGKGIPAALFMSATRSVLKAQTDKGAEPAEVLYKVNNEICRGNETCMFVTLFYGILSIRTGEIVYSNAGHNPPYIYRHDGSLEELKQKQGIALGTMEDMPYGQDKLLLGAGDSLLLYTDGVSEAMSRTLELFSETRLQASIVNGRTCEPRDIVNNLMNDVRAYTLGAAQSDDITILALTYRGDQAEAGTETASGE